MSFNGHVVNPARVLVRWKKQEAAIDSPVAAIEWALRTEDAQAFGASATRVTPGFYSTLGGVGWIEFDDAAEVRTALARGETAAALTATAGEDVLSATELKSRIAALQASGLFDYVEPDYIQHTSATPNDAGFGDGRLWGLRNTGQSGGVSGMDTQVVSAWDLTTGSSNVIVAVIDTGVRHSHRDLAANMWRNPGETAGNGVDDDSNGIVDDVFGFNSINNSGNPMDDNGHGSHCAGTIGGSANDAGELVGVAWTVRLMGLKFLGAEGGGNLSDSIKCIDYAIAKGAHIISGSYGGGGFSQATADAIERARQAGILCIFAAGNETNNNDANPSYPASYPHNNIVSVAAIDRSGALANFSNFGATSVDLAAPGVAIFSCNFQNDSAYQTISGTSMATPHVAGVAALLKARNPGEGYAAIRERLLGSTRALTALQGKVATGGMVQARAAMDLSADDALEVSVSVTPTPLRAGEPATFTARVTDLTPVTGATVTGTLAGSTSMVFRNDGIAPDTRAGDNLYTARTTVPEAPSGNLSLTLNVTAPGKTNFSTDISFPIVTRAANDNFAAAATLDLAAVPVQSTNVDSTREAGEPAHAGNTGGRSLWWTWTAPSGGTAQISTTGSSFDTLLAVYTGSALNALTSVASNDDTSTGNLQSTVEFTATAGATYRIAIDGFNGASGTVVLNATFTGSGGGNTPPAFVRQPASVRVQQGETIRLPAEVTGTPPPALQWTFNGAPLANGGRISGAQSAELVITSAEAGDGGSYALGATNAAGTATSLTAVV
ncbi:MAG: S8 family serine peptidase, partial [Opitutaceae bacterium]